MLLIVIKTCILIKYKVELAGFESASPRELMTRAASLSAPIVLPTLPVAEGFVCVLRHTLDAGFPSTAACFVHLAFPPLALVRR